MSVNGEVLRLYEEGKKLLNNAIYNDEAKIYETSVVLYYHAVVRFNKCIYAPLKEEEKDQYINKILGECQNFRLMSIKRINKLVKENPKLWEIIFPSESSTGTKQLPEDFPPPKEPFTIAQPLAKPLTKPLFPYYSILSPTLSNPTSKVTTSKVSAPTNFNGLANLQNVISHLPSTPNRQNCIKQLQTIDKNILEMIVNEMKVNDSSGPTFDDIIGLDQAKASLSEMVIYPMIRPDLFIDLRSPAKGLLLFGPPGTGKTFVVRALSNKAQCRFFALTASTLVSKWVGEGEKLVKALFTVANAVQPSIIFIDEIDALLSSRSNEENESSRRMKTEFLVNLDGFTSSPENSVVFIGATNRPSDLDAAILRRLPCRIYISLPTVKARIDLMKHTLKNTPVSLKEEEYEQIGESTELFSNADIVLLCKDACMHPIREIVSSSGPNITNISNDQIRPVVVKDFLLSLKNIRPSINANSLEAFKKWNDEYGSKT